MGSFFNADGVFVYLYYEDFFVTKVSTPTSPRLASYQTLFPTTGIRNDFFQMMKK